MKIEPNFRGRVEKLESIWRSLLHNSQDEHQSSLEMAKLCIQEGLALLDNDPPNLKRTISVFTRLIQICSAETFILIHKPLLTRININIRVLEKVKNQQDCLKTTIEAKIKSSFPLVLKIDNKNETVTPNSGSIGSFSAQLAKRHLLGDNPAIEKILEILQELDRRFNAISSRYMIYKTNTIKSYLEGVNKKEDKIRETSADIICELRTENLSRKDLERFVSNLAHSTSSKRQRITWFLESLRQKTLRAHTFFVPISNIKLDVPEFHIGEVTFHKTVDFVINKYNTNDYTKSNIDEFLNKNRKGILAQIKVLGIGHDQRLLLARAGVETALNLLRFRKFHHRIEHPFEVDPLEIMVADEKMNLGVDVDRDRKRIWSYEVNDREKRFLEKFGSKQSKLRNRNSPLAKTIETTLYWVGRTNTALAKEAAFVYLIIALETLLVSEFEENRKSELIAKYGVLVGKILGSHRDEYLRIFKRLYKIRNEIAHTGLYYSKHIHTELMNLEGLVLACLDNSLVALEKGCKTTKEMLKWQEMENEKIRKRRISSSKIKVGNKVSFNGYIYINSRKVVARIKGKIELIDEGNGGFAYHRVTIEKLKRLGGTISGSDNYSIRTEINNYKVTFNTLKCLGGNDLFWAIASRSQNITCNSFAAKFIKL